jgi:hypothetical protein
MLFCGECEMGMYCHFYRVPPAHLQEMLDDADVADAFLAMT